MFPAPPGLFARYTTTQGHDETYRVIAFDSAPSAYIATKSGTLIQAARMPGFVCIEEEPRTTQYVRYDEEADAAHCQILPRDGGLRCVEIANGLIVEVNEDGDFVAVEVIGVRGWLGKYCRPGATDDPAKR